MAMLREPLVHFLFAGAVLFVLFATVGDQSADGAVIEVTPEQRALIAGRFARAWGRQPTAEELRGAMDAWVREEMLYREGVALGLDRGDPVLRGRISQKMLMVAEAAASTTPEEGELEAFFAEHREDYRRAPVWSLTQVFFSAGAGGTESTETRERLEAAREALAGGADPAQFGNATLLPTSLENAVGSYVTGVFGEDFSAALDSLAPGVWSGPVTSAFGQHLVRVDARAGGELPSLDQVRERVLQDWAVAQREAARDALVAALRARYEVVEVPAGG
jgi:hypothetical protein